MTSMSTVESPRIATQRKLPAGNPLASQPRPGEVAGGGGGEVCIGPMTLAVRVFARDLRRTCIFTTEYRFRFKMSRRLGMEVDSGLSPN